MLVGVFFAAGYAARMQVMAREQQMAAHTRSRAPGIATGTRIASVDLQGAGDVDFRPVETLYSVLKNLREHYVEQLTPKVEGQMTYDALRSMLASLKDPNTRFLEPAQRKVIADAQENRHHGIGAVLAIRIVDAPVALGELSGTAAKPVQAASAKSAAAGAPKKPASAPAKGVKAAPAAKIREEHLIVVSVLPGSPAAEAGLKPGDDIIAIDGKSVLAFDPFQRIERMIKQWRGGQIDRALLQKKVDAEQERVEKGISIYEAESMLMSEDKKPFELTVLSRGAARTRKVKVQPREFTVESVTSSVADGGAAGYIKINSFAKDTGDGFAEAMRDLQGRDLKGLIIDLRGVAGGDVEAATQVARWFVPGKTLAMVARSRNRRAPIKVPAIEGEQRWTKPVVVLVNEGTARTGEVLASGLKEHGVARLVGQTTYGDFVETTLIDQLDGSAVMMSTGAYLTSNGASHEGKGLAVDLEVAAVDRQLKEAVKLLGSTEGRS